MLITTSWSISIILFKVSAYSYEPICLWIFHKKYGLIITWLSTSESFPVAETYQGGHDYTEATMIKINIPKGCCNAGAIDLIGMSWVPAEMETLIPPYSVFYVKNISEDCIELDLVKDSRDEGYTMEAIF